MINALLSFAAIYLLFERFGNIKGWTLGEISLCFAVTNASFAITETFSRGFDLFSQLVVSGDFDRLMLRPRSTVLQVLGSKLDFTRLSKLAVSFAVISYAVTVMDTQWNALKVLTVLLMLTSGFFVFSGMFILGATVCFWTVQGLEFINIFTDGGRELASYPLPIYQKWLARFFTFVIPFGSFNYLPLLYVTGRSSNPMYMLASLLGIAFIVPCLLVWNFGVRHYLSTGN
jgi:ABC-2 type transport system permease protein